jgi:hypothetical protein
LAIVPNLASCQCIIIRNWESITAGVAIIHHQSFFNKKTTNVVMINKADSSHSRPVGLEMS